MELIERSGHLAALARYLHEARDGQGRLVLVGGEAGVGKTALARRFGEKVQPETRAFIGYCDPLSTPRPLGPLLDIAVEMQGELGWLISSAAPRHRLFSAFLAALDRGPEPVVAVIEDVHWADEATLDLLRFLGRRLGATHGLVIATYRDDEIGPLHSLQLVLGDLATAASVRRLPLQPLSVDSVRILARGSNLDPVALHGRTGGNPFFVTEVLATGSSGFPATVRDAVLARAARLSPAGRDALDAAAVIGSPAEPWLLTAASDATTETLEECRVKGMLRAEGKALVFRHELARVAVLEAIAPPRRLELHAKVLASLQTSTSPNQARLAFHADEAGDGEAVLDFAPVAAERAAALGAHREAAAQYARALRFAGGLPPARRGALLEARSYESILTDQVAEGLEAGQAALDIWRQLGDRLREGDSLRRLSRLFWLAGRREDAERAGWDALAVLEPLPPGAQLAMAYSTISQLHAVGWNLDEAIAWGDKAIALAERLGEQETLVHALNNVGMARLGAGDKHGHEQLERSLQLALEANLEEHAARAFSNLGLSLVVDYRFADADRFLLEGIAYCAERDLDQQHLYMLAWRALSLFHQGRWSEADEAAREVIRWPRVSPTSRIMALVALGRVGVRRGDPEAGRLLDEALALATQTSELQRLGPVRVARAEAAWLAGDNDRVVAEARETLGLVILHKHHWLQGELSFWLWRTGGLEISTPGIREPFSLQIAGHWSDAAARWRAVGCPYEAAWALADGGNEASLRAAHAEFTRLGATPAAEIMVKRLRTMGAAQVPRGPRPTTRANPERLTSKEMEILALIAEDLTNVEIARRVYRSPRTVAHHVSSILTKLGVRSRQEAAHEAARRGIASQNRHMTSPK